MSTTALRRITIGQVNFAGQSPEVELAHLLNSFADGVPYIASDPIPLGLYFMLNRRDRPVRPDELLEAVRTWQTSDAADYPDNVRQAFALLCEFCASNGRWDAPLRQFLARVLVLYRRMGVDGAREYYAAWRYLGKVRLAARLASPEWLW